jgi:hypothetical protein
LMCPVCRRVTNDCLPILPPVKIESPSTSFKKTEVTDDWLTDRLEEFNKSDLVHRLYQADPYSQEVRNFFNQTPAKLNNDHPQLDHANLILAQLFAAGSLGEPGATTNSSSTMHTAIQPLLELAIRHPHALSTSEMEQEEPNLEMWIKFVTDRFLGEKQGRRRRLSLLSTDLTLVLIEWLLYCPNMRFATRVELQAEAKRVLLLLIPFAKLQDVILDEVFKVARQDSFRDSAERGIGVSADALRAIATHAAIKKLNEPLPPYRLSMKERESIGMIADVVVQDFDDDLVVRDAVAQLINQALPKDCLPFSPIGPRYESQVTLLKRHAALLLGSSVSGIAEQEKKPLTEGVKGYLKRGMMTFFRELLELIGSPDRPMGVEVTSFRLLCSAMLPSFYPEPVRFTSLIRLPREYSALTVAYLARQAYCSKCQTSPEFPAICLCCGMLVCWQSECCRSNGISELFTHGARCPRGIGRSTGIFLTLKTCVVVVLLEDNRHCVWGSLYLDSHNEEDRNLARGKPLCLNMERFEALERVHKSQSWLLETKLLEHVRVNL